MKFQIMIAIGNPDFLYEIWGVIGEGLSANDHIHHGFYRNRSEAEKALNALQLGG